MTALRKDVMECRVLCMNTKSQQTMATFSKLATRTVEPSDSMKSVSRVALLETLPKWDRSQDLTPIKSQKLACVTILPLKKKKSLNYLLVII